MSKRCSKLTEKNNCGSIELDCNNTPNGTAYIDGCGDCVGGDTGLSECFLDLEEYLPEDFNIISIYPNPFNPVSTIKYSVPYFSLITIQVYDLSGKLVKVLADNKSHSAGIYDLILNTDYMASGSYFVNLNTKNKQITHKITVIK